jgi:hypothetical protein
VMTARRSRLQAEAQAWMEAYKKLLAHRDKKFGHPGTASEARGVRC